MNGALILKSFREVWFTTAVFALGAAGLQALIAAVMGSFGEDLSVMWLQVEFFQTMLEALIGTRLEGAVGGSAVSSIALTHPILLTLVWAHEISTCTRIPAGEIDRGTIDIVLGLPISRTRLFLCESASWLLTGTVVLCAAWGGHMIGQFFLKEDYRVAPGHIAMVLVNLLCLYFAVGGLAWLVSSNSERRGRAVGITVAVLLASFLWNFLIPFWKAAEPFAFLGILDYYRPWSVLSSGEWPISDMFVLVLIGAVSWSVALVTFQRRDICTV